MSKRTLFLIFALFIITSVLLAMALYKPSQTNPPATTQTITPIEPVAQTSLSFGNITSSRSAQQETKETYYLPINIATGENKVTAVQLELQYDPKVLTSVAVTPGSFFKNPIILLNQIDVKTGRISYAFGVNPSEQGVAGKAAIAALAFKAVAGIKEETSILFLPKTKVTAEGITQSVLKETNAAQFTVEKTSTPSAQ